MDGFPFIERRKLQAGIVGFLAFCFLRSGFYVGDEGFCRPSVADVDLADDSLGIDEDGSQVVIPVVDELPRAGEVKAELLGNGVYVGDFAGEEAPFFKIRGEGLSVVFEDFWGVKGGIKGNAKESKIVGGLGIVLQRFAGCFEVLRHSRAEFGERATSKNEGENEDVSFEVAQSHCLVFLIDEGIVWQGVSDPQWLDFARWPRGGRRLRGGLAVLDCLDLAHPSFHFGDVESEGNGGAGLKIDEFFGRGTTSGCEESEEVG